MPEPANLGVPIESQSWWHYSGRSWGSYNWVQFGRDVDEMDRNAKKCLNALRIERMMFGRMTEAQQTHAAAGNRSPIEILFLQAAVGSMGAYLMSLAAEPKIADPSLGADAILRDLQRRVSGWFDTTIRTVPAKKMQSSAALRDTPSAPQGQMKRLPQNGGMKP